MKNFYNNWHNEYNVNYEKSAKDKYIENARSFFPKHNKIIWYTIIIISIIVYFMMYNEDENIRKIWLLITIYFMFFLWLYTVISAWFIKGILPYRVAGVKYDVIYSKKNPIKFMMLMFLYSIFTIASFCGIIFFHTSYDINFQNIGSEKNKKEEKENKESPEDLRKRLMNES